MGELRGRLALAFAIVLLVVVVGAAGYYALGGGRWSFGECLYMTVISVTTVGFSESLPDFASVPGARPFTIVLIAFGVGSFLYFASTLTAAIIEGDLRGLLKERRMQREIDRMRNHVIVCGAGSTGRHVIEEMVAGGTPVVAIDTDEARLREVLAGCKPQSLSYIVGDATSDAILEKARLSDARGLVAALANDKDNLYLVVSARQANPGARIIARGSDLEVLEKLKKAGADSVVSPNYIGGLRMASELLRPLVVRFLDEVLREPEGKVRIEHLEIPKGSRHAGRKLAEVELRKRAEVLVLAARPAGEDVYHYGPGADFELGAGMTLVVLGSPADLARARALLESGGE